MFRSFRKERSSNIDCWISLQFNNMKYDFRFSFVPYSLVLPSVLPSFCSSVRPSIVPSSIVPSVRPSFRPSVSPSVRLSFLHSSFLLSFICFLSFLDCWISLQFNNMKYDFRFSFVPYSLVLPSFCSSVRPSIVPSSIVPSVRPSVRPSVLLSVCPSFTLPSFFPLFVFFLSSNHS